MISLLKNFRRPSAKNETRINKLPPRRADLGTGCRPLPSSSEQPAFTKTLDPYSPYLLHLPFPISQNMILGHEPPKPPPVTVTVIVHASATCNHLRRANCVITYDPESSRF